ncbi:phytase [Saccharicrinis sp. FJH54]|uniref:phytase n=1 Tax=Saccharicrinis sp. FJH54 TaxID=3344665 RepID=UPI0035D4D2C2
MKNRLIYYIPSLLVFFVLSCNRPGEGSRKAGEHIKHLVNATTETTPVPEGRNDDSADDPAIWINRTDPEKSIIVGTDKKGGMATYNLDGKELYYLASGKMNNCDIRQGYSLNGDTVDIVAASNRSFQSISLFQIYPDGKLDTVHARLIPSQMQDEVYGLCMYHSRKTEKFFVFVNSKAGEVEQWELFTNGNKVDAKMVRSFSVGTQTEGMVTDDENAVLYLGEEQAGIWKFNAEPDGSTNGTFVKNSSEDNRNIKYDIEGLAIYDSGNGNGLLMASSQGNYTYAVFERQDSNRYLGSFRITDGEVDGVEETDGIDISAVPMGPKYPKGILVVQDGYNYDGRKKMSQNYKYISMDSVLNLFKY